MSFKGLFFPLLCSGQPVPGLLHPPGPAVLPEDVLQVLVASFLWLPLQITSCISDKAFLSVGYQRTEEAEAFLNRARAELILQLAVEQDHDIALRLLRMPAWEEPLGVPAVAPRACKSHGGN